MAMSQPTLEANVGLGQTQVQSVVNDVSRLHRQTSVLVGGRIRTAEHFDTRIGGLALLGIAMHSNTLVAGEHIALGTEQNCSGTVESSNPVLDQAPGTGALT